VRGGKSEEELLQLDLELLVAKDIAFQFRLCP